MSPRRFWSRSKNYRPVTLLQQLEERIVLDAAVNPAPQDNPNGQPDQGPGLDQSTAGDQAPAAADTAGHADGNAGLVATVPDSYHQVFNQDLNVVLVANNLADVQAVSGAATSADAKVIVFDAAKDNLASVTAKLQDVVNSTGHKIDNLAIVGHGAEGLLNIGTDQIQLFSLGDYKPTFQLLGQTLSENAQIQFYGCSLAGNVEGQALVASIAVYTAADTFASTDTTGGNAHDWTLEYSSNSAVAMHSVLNVESLAADNTPLAAPVLVKDIDTSATSYPSGYTPGYAVMGGKVYFAAADGINSTDSYGEPMVYDPSTGTTSLLKDIRPLYSSQPQYFTISGGKLFFSATDTSYNFELYVSDGIAGGDTHMIKEINTAGSAGPAGLVDVGGTLYFTANDGTGVALWKTDGTDVNTVKVANTIGLTSPSNLTNVNGTLMFTGNTAATGVELFKVNAGGSIELVKDFNGTTGTSSPTALTAVGGKLYLTANTGTVNLWQSDGTTAGTVQVTNTLGLTSPTNLTNVNGALMFTGTTTTTGLELYKVVDGAPGSIALVKDFNGTTTSSSPSLLTNVNGTLYLTANDGTGVALWQSDGTGGGTTKVANTAGVTAFANLANINGQLFFAGTSAATGQELYKVDGVNGVTLVQDIYVGTTSSGPTALKDIGGGKLIFTANNGYTGNEPWISDGVNPATSLDINHTGGSSQWLTNVNGTLYFAASDGGHGTELWKSDGTAAGTTMVMDLNPGSYSGVTSYGTGVPMANVNGTLFFLGSTSTGTDSALYKIDNTTGLPVLVKNVIPGYVDWLINLTPVDNTLYFTNYDAGNYKLWKSDGTATGTVEVTDLSGASLKGTANLTNVNGTLFFQAGNNTPTGAELWKIDNTTGKAVMVQDLAPGSYVNSSPSDLINVNGTLYFTATVGGVKGIYYTSDGVTINPVTNSLGVAISATPYMTNVNGTLFFTGTTAATGAELFYVDATNTIQVVDTITGATGSSPTNLYYSPDGTLYFSGNDSTNGKEVWTYTTAGGASILKDINPGTGSSFFTSNSFIYLDGLTYFKATDGTTGDELWQTDGTPGGTVQVGDIMPGTNGSNPGNLTAVNNTLFFTATGLGTGTELYKVDSAGTNTIPTATNMTQSHTITEDAPAFNFTPIVVTDGDAGDVITATLDLDNAVAGVLSANNGASYNAATGFWSISGTADQVNTALANVTFTPNADWNGTANITTHVQDAKVTGPANGIISINVTAMNDAPTVAPQTVNLNEDPAAPVAIVLSGNPGPADEQGQTLTYVLGDLTGINGKLYSDAAGTIELLSGATLVASSSGQSPVTVYYMSDANYNGAPSFTYAATDNGGVPVQGVTAPATVTINVAAVNDAPVNTVPGPLSIAEDVQTAITGVSVFDVDAGTSVIQVTLSVTNGTLQVNNAVVNGLLPAQILNNGTSFVVLSGTLAEINATLADATGLQYLSVLNYNGPDTLTISTSDLGATGIPGPLTDVDSVAITVTPVPDAPVNTVGSLTLPPGISLVSLAGQISVHDGDVNDMLFVSISAGPGVTGIGYGMGPASPQFVFGGTESFLNPLLNNLTAHIQPGFYGQASIQVTTTDLSGLSATNVLPITIGAPVLPPQITPGAVGYMVYEDHVGPVNLGSCVNVSDPNGDPLTVDLVASAGWNALNATASGAAIVTGGGTTALHITGSMVDVQNTLASLNGTLNANFNGNATFNVTASDGTNPPVSTPVDVPIIAVNDAPVLTVPVAQPFLLNTPLVITGIGVADLDVNETAPLNNVVYMQLDAAHGTLSLADTNGLTFDAGHGNGTGSVWFTGNLLHVGNALASVTYTPALDYVGLDSLSVVANDLGHSGTPGPLTATGTIDLIPPNVPPQLITGLVGHTVYEDPVAPVDLSGCVTVSDLNGDPLTVDLTATAGWSGLNAIASGAAVVTGNGTTALHIAGAMVDVQNTLATLAGTLNANFNGTASFGVTASDGVALVTGAPVDVPIIAVNDAPVNTVPVSVTANEDVLTPITGISISDVDAGTSAIQVTLSVLNGTLQVNAAVGGGLTAAGITGNGSGSVVLNGTLAEINATLADATGLQYQSALNYNGPDALTVLTSDLGATGTGGPLTDSDPIAITVNAVNDAPVNTVPLSATAETNALTPITGISISDVDAGTNAVQVTLSVLNGTLQVNDAVGGGLTAAGITGNGSGSVVLTGTLAEINATLADATGLRYLSALDYSGPDTLTVLTSDLGATGTGGPLTATDPVAITVNALAVNDAPVVSLNGAVQQTDSTGAVIFNAAHANLISISDVDAGTGLLKVTLTATHGTMTLSGVAGLTFDPGQGDGTADATMTFSGTLTDINNALNGMSFNRTAGYTGLADVTVAVNDQGNTGTGGPQIATSVESISVEPYDVWFAGFGTEAGWEVYNYATLGCAYYTHDHVIVWQHLVASDTWNFYSANSGWVSTNALGNAPYIGGYGPPDQWFHETAGTYSGYDVYLYTGDGTTYFSPDHTAAGATFWKVTNAGTWSYYDGSAWYSTAGFNVEPVNVWFHGYGADSGWDTYNYTAGGCSYYTHDYTVYWQYVDATTQWYYYNGTAWVLTTGLGVVA